MKRIANFSFLPFRRSWRFGTDYIVKSSSLFLALLDPFFLFHYWFLWRFLVICFKIWIWRWPLCSACKCRGLQPFQPWDKSVSPFKFNYDKILTEFQGPSLTLIYFILLSFRICNLDQSLFKLLDIPFKLLIGQLFEGDLV